MRLVVITPKHVAVYEGRKRIAVFDNPGNVTADVIEATRVDKYEPMR